MKHSKDYNAQTVVRRLSCSLRSAGLLLLASSLLLSLTQLVQAQQFSFTQLWFVTNGMANLANDSNNRGLAYNALSNHVYIADRNTAPGSISVLDGTSGSVIAANFPSITIAPYNVGVADDGVIYGVPLANGVAANNLNIYSWTNWQSNQRLCYSETGSDAASSAYVQGQRVGDSFAIFGGGTSTLILLPINTGTTTRSTNNMILFSTTDGQAFTPTVLAVSGLPYPGAPSDGGPEHGVAFVNSTNFLFRPGFGSATFLVGFPANFASLPSPVTATVLSTNANFPANTGSDVYLFSYSPAGKLLASFGALVSSGTQTPLSLYDVSGFPTANSRGGTNAPHANANGNFTGGVALGGQGKTNALYVLDSNNGARGYSITFVPAPVAPVITTAPTGGSLYTNVGSFTFTVTAAGTAPLAYQWQYNTISNLPTASNIPLATNSTLTINPLTVSTSGWYNVVITNTAGSTSSLPVQLTVSTALASAYVSNLWSLAADNSAPYLDTGYNTRGLAFDPMTMSVLVAEHSAAQIYALDATNNGVLKFMITTPLTGLPLGSIFPLGQVGVADDGAVYCCNVSSYQPGQQAGGGVDFSVTRFDSVVTATNGDGSLNTGNTFEAAFTGDPGAFWPVNPGNSSQDRWGDSMAVRGAGTNTQILLGTYETVTDGGGNHLFGTGYGTNVAILTTQDGTNFTATTIAVTNAPDGFAYLGVAWGLGNTFWAKSPGYNLRQVEYDLTTGYGKVILSFATTASAGSLNLVCGIGLDVNNNVLAGVNVGDSPNDLELFQIPSLGFPPEAYFQEFFPAFNPNINGNAATTVKFPYIFSLDANNGIIGLKYSVPLLPFNILTTKINNQEIFTWQTVIGHTYQLQATNKLVVGLSSAWPNVGPPVTAAASGTQSYTNTSHPGSAMYYRVVAH